MTEDPLAKKDTSPRAAGPAGPQFEAKVATHYALAVLAQTEAFGLPGAIVDRLEFQRSGQGHPLDDIIVKAKTRTGEQRCLEVQAKRSLSFTGRDEKFAAVVTAIVEGRKKDAGRRFAVALERTSGPIENGVQEALELSRHATDAQTFLTLLGTPGRGNEDMRRFVSPSKSILPTGDRAIRIGLQACEFPRRKDYDEDQATFDARQSQLSATQSARFTTELQWIEHGVDEPAWPSPPLRRQRRPKRSIRLPGGTPKPPRVRPEPEWPDTHFDDRTAAVWLRMLEQSTDPGAISALLKANRDWLINANGRGDEDDDDTDLERTWTRALFECAATRAKTWTDSERKTLVFDVLDQFSDEACIDTAAAFLVKSDLSHIERNAADTQYLADLRTRLWARLKTTTRWQRHCRSPRGGLEIHLNELILAFFCKMAGGFGHHTSYTKGLKDGQIIPFLPILTEIAVASAPCPSIARLFLDVLELIDPQKVEPYLLSAATSWSSRGDQRFWNELAIGQRVCALAGKAEIQPPAQQWIELADVIAATGVVAGETLKKALRARQ